MIRLLLLMLIGPVFMYKLVLAEPSVGSLDYLASRLEMINNKLDNLNDNINRINNDQDKQIARDTVRITNLEAQLNEYKNIIEQEQINNKLIYGNSGVIIVLALERIFMYLLSKRINKNGQYYDSQYWDKYRTTNKMDKNAT